MPSEQAVLRRWLIDIRHHVILAQSFVAGTDYAVFKDDLLRLYAVIRCLEIISEASRCLPEAMKTRNPAIAWRAMAAAGNVYRHDYEDIAASAVWRTLTYDAPRLLEVVERELANLEQSQ
jgi:uncharacterized protein with HEPN domain